MFGIALSQPLIEQISNFDISNPKHSDLQRTSNLTQIMEFLQSVMSTLLKRVIVPVVNLRLRIGYTLPDFHGYGLENASIVYGESKIVVCCDIAHAYEYIPHQILSYTNVV